MYRHSMSHSETVGIIPLATVTWQQEKSKQQYSDDHSYICPTPKEYDFQGIGLAISNAVAIHIQDVREGKLMEPSEEDREELETYEHLMAMDIYEDLVIPTNPAVADSLLEEVTIYPCPDFKITPQQSDSAIPIPADLTLTPHI